MAGNKNQQIPPPDPALTDGWKPEKPVRSSMEETPKTITASRMSKEEGGMNMPTGSVSNIVLMDPQQSSKMIPFPMDGTHEEPNMQDGKLGDRIPEDHRKVTMMTKE